MGTRVGGSGASAAKADARSSAKPHGLDLPRDRHLKETQTSYRGSAGSQLCDPVQVPAGRVPRSSQRGETFFPKEADSFPREVFQGDTVQVAAVFGQQIRDECRLPDGHENRSCRLVSMNCGGDRGGSFTRKKVLGGRCAARLFE